MSQDRSDLQFANKAVSRHMSSPGKAGWQVLLRLGKYICGARRLVQTFVWGDRCKSIEGFGDSDWAGDRVNGKSTSGGVLKVGGHVVKTWSTSQQTVALSSGEAELYALTKTSSQALGVIQLLADFGWESKAVIYTDSTAAIGMVSRQGLGRTRHIQVQYLWLQERMLQEDLQIAKVGGKDNVADAFTKYLKKEDMDRLLKSMSMHLMQGRADASRRLDSMLHQKFTVDEDETLDQWANLRANYIFKRKKIDYVSREPCELFNNVSYSVGFKELAEIKGQAEASCRWLRLHRKPRNILFCPMHSRDGPSNTEHVPDLRISARYSESEDACTITVDSWKTSGVGGHDAIEQRGWTCFVESLPEGFLRLQKLQSTSV